MIPDAFVAQMEQASREGSLFRVLELRDDKRVIVRSSRKVFALLYVGGLTNGRCPTSWYVNRNRTEGLASVAMIRPTR
jgi:hypothetical protein